MSYKNRKNKIRTAFSLIELSIVLVIISVIISGAVGVSQTAIKNAKVDITRKRIEAIRSAISSFVATNRRLPCPASLHDTTTSATYGVESGPSGDCKSLGVGGGVYTSSNGMTSIDMVYGAVPVRALGLSPEFLSDGFDNKFSYVVPAILTRPTSGNSLTPTVDIVHGFETADPLASQTDSIIIADTLSGSINNIVDNAIYVVISHGANGSGAFNINSGSTRNALAGGDENENSITGVDGGDIFDNVFVASSPSSTFDDVIIYETRNSLIQKLGSLFTTNFCIGSNATYIDPCGNVTIGGFGTVFVGQESDSGDFCGGGPMGPCPHTDYINNDGLTRRRCGVNGQWEPPMYPCRN